MGKEPFFSCGFWQYFSGNLLNMTPLSDTHFREGQPELFLSEIRIGNIRFLFIFPGKQQTLDASRDNG